jgi:hypothetical protein
MAAWKAKAGQRKQDKIAGNKVGKRYFKQDTIEYEAHAGTSHSIL